MNAWGYVCVVLQLSWTAALRSIIRNCYKHHGREDLLPSFEDEQQSPFVMQTINNPDGSLSIIQIDTSCSQLADGREIITLADGTQATVVRTVRKVIYKFAVGTYS